MFRTTLCALALALPALSLPAAAQSDWSWLGTQDVGGGMVRTAKGARPGPGYVGQYWTHPKGCDYSRAGRPGELVWYLIIPTRKKGCPTYIVEHGGADTYRRP